MAQFVKRPTGSGHDLTFLGFEPCIMLCADRLRAWSLLLILSPSLSAPPPFVLSLSLSLSKINIKNYEKIQSDKYLIIHNFKCKSSMF